MRACASSPRVIWWPRHYGAGTVIGRNSVRARSSKDQPLLGLGHVHRHALPFVVEQSQFVLAARVPLFRGTPIKDGSLRVILGYAVTHRVKVAHIGLRVGISVLGDRRQDCRSGDIILPNHGGDALAQCRRRPPAEPVTTAAASRLRSTVRRNLRKSIVFIDLGLAP